GPGRGRDADDPARGDAEPAGPEDRAAGDLSRLRLAAGAGGRGARSVAGRDACRARPSDAGASAERLRPAPSRPRPPLVAAGRAGGRAVAPGRPRRSGLAGRDRGREPAPPPVLPRATRLCPRLRASGRAEEPLARARARVPRATRTRTRRAREAPLRRRAPAAREARLGGTRIRR